MPSKNTPWIKPSAETTALFDTLLPADDAIQRKKMFGMPCAFFRGNMFAWIHQDHLTFRLPKEAREALLRDHLAEPVDPSGKRMREYVMLTPQVVADTAHVRRIIDESLAYVTSLPPKQK